MSVPNFHAKLASQLGLATGATESQILAALAGLRERHDAYRDSRPGWILRPTRWEVIPEGAWVEWNDKAYLVAPDSRQAREGRKVAVKLWRQGKTFPRVYGFDDVAHVMIPDGEMAALRLLRAELGAALMSPEDQAGAA